MSKSFDLNSKSDMKKFGKRLEKTVMDKAHTAILKKKYDVKCPNCKKPITIPVGKSTCPMCRKTIDFKLDIT